MENLPEYKKEVTVTAKVLIHYKTVEQEERLMGRIMRGLHLDVCACDNDGLHSAELLKDTVSIIKEI